MDDTALLLRGRKRRRYRLFDPAQPVRAKDQDILHPAVFQPVKDTQPVFAAFILAYDYGQDFLPAVRVDTQHDIGGKFAYDAVITDGKMDCVYEDDGINLIQGPVLPFLNLREESVGYV